MNEPEIVTRVEWLSAGRQVLKNGNEIWTAGADHDKSRWMHPDLQRTVTDTTVQAWVDGGLAEILP
jgi:hypothetical protein